MQSEMGTGQIFAVMHFLDEAEKEEKKAKKKKAKKKRKQRPVIRGSGGLLPLMGTVRCIPMGRM